MTLLQWGARLKASAMYLKGTEIKVHNAGDQSEWERDSFLDYVL